MASCADNISTGENKPDSKPSGRLDVDQAIDELTTSPSDSIPSATKAKECPTIPARHFVPASTRLTITPIRGRSDSLLDYIFGCVRHRPLIATLNLIRPIRLPSQCRSSLGKILGTRSSRRNYREFS